MFSALLPSGFPTYVVTRLSVAEILKILFSPATNKLPRVSPLNGRKK
jgi:hypothetical protein